MLEDLDPAEQLIDVWLQRSVQERFRCYGAYPLVATQAPGFSDILGQDSEYAFMHTGYRTRPTHRTTPFPESTDTSRPENTPLS